MENKILKLSALCVAIACSNANAQLSKSYGKEGLKVYLSEDSTRYIKGTGPSYRSGPGIIPVTQARLLRVPKNPILLT